MRHTAPINEMVERKSRRTLGDVVKKEERGVLVEYGAFKGITELLKFTRS